MVQQQGVQLVTDNVSYELLKGSKVDFTTDLIRSSFEVSAFCMHSVALPHHHTQSIIIFLQHVDSLFAVMHPSACGVQHGNATRCRSQKIRMLLEVVGVELPLNPKCE